MKPRLSISLVILVLIVLSGCQERRDSDVILYNGIIYTVDKNFSVCEAVVIKDGIFVESGSTKELRSRYRADKKIDLNGQVVYPGFYDAHCHFTAYSESLRKANLVGTSSFEDICEILKEHHPEGSDEWILGHGWDQNDWNIKEYPDRSLLDELFPDQPVFLERIDGHGAIANARALELAGISADSFIEGGEIIVKDGRVTGILVDNAADLVADLIPVPGEQEKKENLQRAEQNCFAVGLSTIVDAGLEKKEVDLIDMLQQTGELKIRVYAMLNPTQENIDNYVLKGFYKTDRLNIRSLKLYADGALGSRGALLIEPYSDAREKQGLQVNTTEFLNQMCKLSSENNFQVATHCIGDSANRLMLSIYKDKLGGKNDRRWRIEHAQIVHPDDFILFGDYSIIPSIQTTHATSDMYWAAERIGNRRIKSAYAYKQLLVQNGWLPNGSDFPVENINPLFGFYAGFSRMDQAGFPEQGWQMENALNREESLKAMTIWAARSCFEENERGSIEDGKMADFVILDQDIMTAESIDIPKIKVLETWIAGEQVYRSK